MSIPQIRRHPEQLADPPLAEAIVEFRWRLKSLSGDPQDVIDPGYPLSVGLMLDKVHDRFPVVEELPIAAVPDQMTPYVVRHRFRAAPGAWPCVQLGPGVATVNFVTDYTWERFRENILYFVPILVETYRRAGQPLDATGVTLRYVNSVALDPDATDVVDYVRSRLNLGISLPQTIERSRYRRGAPEGVVLRLGLPLATPDAIGYIQIGSGKRKSAPALVWDLSVIAAASRAPALDERFAGWLDQAHEVMEEWFFALIAGELEARFGDASAI
jgi:uncharacterized protein (TIGR04255 family)